MSKNHYDVVIVGAGLIGATLANLLAKPSLGQLSVAVVDRADEPYLDLSTPDPRVVAITSATQQTLQGIGVWESIQALRAMPYTAMYVWDGEGCGNISFSAQDLGGVECGSNRSLGHIIENSVLLSCLHNKLKTHSNVDTLYNVDVSDIQSSAAVDMPVGLDLSNDQHITGDLVVAADGAFSPIRQLAGMPIREADYGHTAIVTTVKTTHEHQSTAWQRFGCEGPLAFLPLGIDQHHCSIVWSLNHSRAKALMALDDGEFCRELQQTFEHKLGGITQVYPRYAFPLTRRHADTYAHGGIVLVGDSAHTIHPLAGQGANLGMYDVTVLADEIERAQNRSLPLTDTSISKRYERRRRVHNQSAIFAMQGFKHLFASESLPVRWLRNEGLRQVNKTAWLKNMMVQWASGQV